MTGIGLWLITAALIFSLLGTSYTTRVQPSGVDFVARKLGRQLVEAVSS